MMWPDSSKSLHSLFHPPISSCYRLSVDTNGYEGNHMEDWVSDLRMVRLNPNSDAAAAAILLLVGLVIMIHANGYRLSLQGVLSSSRFSSG